MQMSTIQQYISMDIKTKILLDLSSAEGNVELGPGILTEFKQITAAELSRLPDRKKYSELAKKLADYYKALSADRVVLGNGSDEIIQSIAAIYGSASTITLVPTFGRLIEAVSKSNPERLTTRFALSHTQNYVYSPELHHDLLAQISDSKPSILWLCSPNNPTGTMISRSQIKELARAMPKNGVVVVDEVFMDFLEEPQHHTAITLLETCENIIILNSFSKTWGVAGLRLGFAITSKGIASTLRTHGLMYNVNSVALNIGLGCLRESQYRHDALARTRELHNQIVSTVLVLNNFILLHNAPINLLCLRLRNYNDLHTRLMSAGILTKNLDRSLGFEQGFVRIRVPMDHLGRSKLLKTLGDINDQLA